MNTIYTCGIKITPMSVSEILSCVREQGRGENGCFQITGVNLEQIALLYTDKRFSNYLNQSDIVNIDGTIVYLYLKLKRFNKIQKTLCADLFHAFLEEANLRHESVYLLGATQEVVECVAKKIEILYPYLKLVGFDNGYFKSDEDIIKKINTHSPTYLFLGMPSPMKERFISENKAKLNVKVCFGVGGMFDIIAGKAKRAPAWVQKFGLEWLYRITQNPVGHSKRVAKALFPCLKIFLKYLFEKRNQVIEL